MASAGRPLSLTPGAKVLRSPLTDDTIWKRLKEAGFDEESIKRRDKAALISYIAKLEAEIHDLQHHMGLLILERKELASTHEQIKASTEASELLYKRNQAANLSSLCEAKKREDSLKKALGVNKECIASLEKALHEMRAEAAETKISAECKLAEARKMVEDSQKKFMDANTKLHAAEALQTEASRSHRSAERKLQEVEAREDDLRRRINEFKTDCDVRERELSLERQSLSERRKVLQQEHERVLDGQALLNQRDEYIASKTQELNRFEKELEASRKNIDMEVRSLNEEKLKLDLRGASLSQREEAVIGKECILNKREQDLLVLQEKLASKESVGYSTKISSFCFLLILLCFLYFFLLVSLFLDEMQVEVQKVIANQEAVLRTRKSEFEAELEIKRKVVEDEIEAKRRAWELREVDLHQREDLLLEKEHDFEVQSRTLEDKEKDVTEKMNVLDDKERSLSDAQKDLELMRSLVEKEREDINRMKVELKKSSDSLEDKSKQVDCVKEKLETMKSETDELSLLEIRLKEEVDTVRAQKLEIMAEEDRLKMEKAKFEAEWELIDERREALRKQAECVAEEREAISKLIRDERKNLKEEKKAMWQQHKHDVELFNREREEFTNKMLQERYEWFNKIQKEHEDFLLGIEMQKKELESSIEKRREEVESYLKDKEKAFELEKINELHRVNSFNEKAVQELEQVALEMKKLDNARMEINIDREQRERERAVLNKSIEELKEQTQKLEKQRELLRAEREEVSAQVDYLKKLEDLKLALDNIEVAEIQLSNMETSQRKLFAMKCLKNNTSLSQDINLVSNERVDGISNGGGPDSYLKQKSSVTLPSNSARLSWIKRCTNLIFKNSSEMSTVKGEAKSLMPDLEKVATSNTKFDSSSEYYMQNSKASEEFGKGDQNAFGQPKVILEVRPEDDVDKGLHSREPEIKEDSNERINHLISEQPSQHGKKRRVGAASDDFVSPLPGQLKKNKKRRQVEKVNADLSGNSINNTMHASMMEDQIHHNETEGGAEDTNILDVDKFIKITEVTCEITKMDNIASEHPLRHQQSAQIPVEDIVEDEGTNGHVNSRNVGSGVSLCDLGVLDMEASQVSKEEQRENVGQSSGHDQSQEKLNKGGVTTEDPVVDASEDVDNVGARTRSKRKL
ncbi:hypothetical protein K2173_014761 [Erythroxylum novogranatense]|uniref:Nuclear matrix constituent protein 1-like protein n=1 Tax=Erythroxylum novogranatense TaxID=1862640 RepID=A0AAV8THF8_9ROSI|nr:hypothetical protein K2173_014761 [Erythroxylum novogranatense]